MMDDTVTNTWDVKSLRERMKTKRVWIFTDG